MNRIFTLYLAITCITVVRASVKWTANMKSFSHAEKNGHCYSGKEIILFERNTNVPAVVTEQWYTGAGCFSNNSWIRYYIDDETEPSIEGNLYMMHGIGFTGTGTAWGTKWLGHLAKNGGLYNTFRIPYQKSIRVSLQVNYTGYFWYILRGVENYPVIIEDIQLPSNARLRLSKIENHTYAPFEFITMASSHKSGGMLFMVTLAGQSNDFVYLEGCYRFMSGNDTHIQYLSSGTEDFFLSAYYFNLNYYKTDDSGLTYFDKSGTMSAYKIFAKDPIMFTDKFRLIWRQSEKDDNNCYRHDTTVINKDGTRENIKKPFKNKPWKNLKYGPTVISSYVWFYEW